MDLKVITEKDHKAYNQAATHVVQSWEWGEFRKKLGLPLLRFGLFDKEKLTSAFQITLHKIPFTNQFVGYLPKGPFPNSELAKALIKIGQDYNCAAIKVEPNILVNTSSNPVINRNFKKSKKSLFTKFNFLLDLTKSEEELLKSMHPKFRYNIKVAQKHGVWVEERTDEEGFNIYLKLYFDTAKRQSYHGHNTHYHTLAWETLKGAGMARVLIAFYKPEGQKKAIPLASWMLLNFKDTYYYPYGGSSTEYKQVMAPTLLAWEAVKLGKKMGLKSFDLWGALEPNAPENHPWQGFHQFKQRLGGQLAEYIGTYDIVFNTPLYLLFDIIDRSTSLKVMLLKLLRK